MLGFLVRLAERNGREDVLAFARSLGMPFAVIEAAATKRFGLADLSRATLIPVKQLEAMAYWPLGSSQLRFRGVPITRSMVTLSRRHICPQCLAEGPYHRAAWDLTLNTACPKHCLRLISACPSCSVPLGWAHPSIRFCRCGFDLARAGANVIPVSELDGTIELHRIFGLPTGQAESRPLLSAVFLALGPDAVVSLMLHFGWYATGGTGLPRPVKASRQMRDLHIVLDAGYRVTVDWPASFHSFLEVLREQAGRRDGRYGASKEFGPFMDWVLGLDRDGPLGHLLWPELERFVAARPELVTRSQRLAGPRGEERNFVTLAEAARRLRCSIVHVHDVLARNHLLARADGRGRGAPILARRSDIDNIASELAKLRDRRALARELGCGRKCLNALLAADVLASAQGVAAELRRVRCWRASDAAALIATLERSVAPGSGAHLPFPAALRALRQHGLGPAEAVNALVGGALTPVGVDAAAVGLARVLFKANDVAGLNRVTQMGPAGLSISEAAMALGLKQQVAYNLCSSGIIQTVDAHPPFRGRRVPTSELERFRKEFVVPGQKEKGIRRHRGWLAARLLRAGAVPVIGPTVDGGRQYVFRRLDFERLTKDL